MIVNKRANSDISPLACAASAASISRCTSFERCWFCTARCSRSTAPCASRSRLRASTHALRQSAKRCARTLCNAFLSPSEISGNARHCSIIDFSLSESEALGMGNVCRNCARCATLEAKASSLFALSVLALQRVSLASGTLSNNSSRRNPTLSDSMDGLWPCAIPGNNALNCSVALSTALNHPPSNCPRVPSARSLSPSCALSSANSTGKTGASSSIFIFDQARSNSTTRLTGIFSCSSNARAVAIKPTASSLATRVLLAACQRDFAARYSRLSCWRNSRMARRKESSCLRLCSASSFNSDVGA